ncbi:MAG: carboxypeptidase-like regulatory domain-containing protein [Bacteroidota bacterium]
MKLIFSLLPVLAALCGAGSSNAQNSILAGKVVDENNRPIRGAVVTVKSKATSVTVESDSMGLFNTKLLPGGKYTVSLDRNERHLKAGTVDLRNGNARYYLATVKGKRVEMQERDKNLFIETKLAALQARKHFFDLPTKTTMHVVMDSTGKVKEIYEYPGERIPQISK